MYYPINTFPEKEGEVEAQVTCSGTEKDLSQCEASLKPRTTEYHICIQCSEYNQDVYLTWRSTPAISVKSDCIKCMNKQKCSLNVFWNQANGRMLSKVAFVHVLEVTFLHLCYCSVL